jgi:diguanylate cyclase (GGDEF)-like protein
MVCAWSVYHASFKWYGESQVNAATGHVSSFAAALNSLLSRHESLPKVLALEDTLVDLLRHPQDPAARAAANGYLESVAEAGGVLIAYLIDANGITLAASNWATPATLVGQNYAFRPYFVRAIKEGFGRLYALGVTTFEPGYYLAAPVQREGRTLGVVVVKVNLTVLEAELTSTGKALAVLDEIGVVILSSVPSWRYRPLSPLAPATIDMLRSTKRYAGDLKPIDTQGVPGVPSEHVEIQIDGVRRELNVVSQPTGPLGWRAVSFVNLTETRRVALIAAAAAACACAMALALLLYVQLRRKRTAELMRSRAETESTKARLRTVADHLPVMVAFIGGSGHYLFANALYAQMYGREVSGVEGKDVQSVLHPQEYAVLSGYLERAFSGETVVFPRPYSHLPAYRHFECTYRPQWNADRTEVVGVHVMTQETTENRRRLDELARLSQLDHLTQLLNRKGFEARLSMVVQASAADGTMFAVLAIDLDNFKPVNDTYGHAVGDAVLRGFSERLLQSVRACDAVARIGGDEFGVVLPSIADVGVAERLASEIVRMAQQLFDIDGRAVSIGASVGVVYQQGRGLAEADLYELVDKCLYEAKRCGKRSYRLAQPAVDRATAAEAH